MKNTLIPGILLVFLISSCFAQSRDERKVGHFTAVKAGGSFDVFLKKGTNENVVIEAQSGPIDKIVTEVVGNTLKIYVEDHHNNYRFRDVNIYVTFSELEEITGSGSGSVRLESPLNSPQLYLSSSGSGSLYCTEDLESASSVKINNSGSGGCKIASIKASGDVDVRNSGSGGVTIDALYADELSVHNSGSGGLKLMRGNVADQSIVLSGSGSYYAEDLESNRCDVRKSGSGSVHVNVKDQITGNSSGSGNVYVRGTSARVDFHSSGSGKIKVEN